MGIAVKNSLHQICHKYMTRLFNELEQSNLLENSAEPLTFNTIALSWHCLSGHNEVNHIIGNESSRNI